MLMLPAFTGAPELNRIHNCDALTLLRAMPSESVNCIVTSPPYYGLRDYGVDGQIGLEDTPEQFVAALVSVFREARRVLRNDGTLWLNLGDSYAGGGGFSAGAPSTATSKSGKYGSLGALKAGGIKPADGVKPKDLIGIPWMVAFALRADGWYLRSDIIWHKPNPMPESVTDRPTKSHEYVFLLTKSASYWYDADAIKEDSMDPTDDRKSRSKPGDKRLPTDMVAGVRPGSATYSKRNKRSVWTISTKPFKDAHFATFPPDLIEPMILAGCPDKVCAECGAPYEKVMSDERLLDTNRPQARRALELFEAKGLTESHLEAIRAVGLADAGKTLTTMDGAGKNTDEMQRLADEAKAALGGYYREFTFGQRSVTGLQPTCSCNADTVAGVVYDPFMGSGTTARVAVKLGRQYIGSEINYEYACMGRDSLRKPFEKTLRKKESADLSSLPMFATNTQENAA